MGLSLEEYKQFSKEEMERLNQQTAEIFYQHGADLCIKTAAPHASATTSSPRSPGAERPHLTH
jgi:hypothetical protein